MEEKPAFQDEQEPVRVRTKDETDKKCPQCGGVMEFDPATGGMKCPYCEYAEEIAAGEAAREIDFEDAEDRASHDWGAAKKRVLCESCGAETIYDALEVANECPYCGSNQVMEVQDGDTMAPGGVCPFKIDKKTAGSSFKRWIAGKLFCPSLAKQKARPDAFHGVYLPYWTFDTQTESEYDGRYGIYRTVREADGKTRTVTDWYYTSGDYSEFVNDHPVLATARHDASILNEILPFDTEANVAYNPRYLAGYAAERYSIGLNDGWEQGREEIHDHLERQVEQKIRSECRADTVANVNVQTSYDDLKFKYLLLPVWLSSFRYNGKVYNFMVNGQTGRVGGKSPISALRVAIAVLLTAALIGGAWYFINKRSAPSAVRSSFQGPARTFDSTRSTAALPEDFARRLKMFHVEHSWCQTGFRSVVSSFSAS